MSKLTVHLFANSKIMQNWIDQNAHRMHELGWKHRTISQYHNDASGDVYRLVVATHRGAVESLRGIVINELDVTGPWTDDLIALHDAALRVLFPNPEVQS